MLNEKSFTELLRRESLDAEEVLQGLLLLSLSAHQEPTWLEKQLHSKVFSFGPFDVNPVLIHFTFKSVGSDSVVTRDETPG